MVHFSKIYFDHNATSPLHPEVLKVVNEAEGVFGNPSSIHWAGREARKKLSAARLQVANLLGAHESELLFTSGGTESINTAIQGVWKQQTGDSKQKSRHQIITTPVEHQATLRTLEFLESQGAEIVFLKVDAQGKISLEELSQKINDNTLLVSVMFANNEIGNLYPIHEIGKICRDQNILFHCDAVQAVGKTLIDLKNLPVDLLSFSAHKFHGPKGVGGLFVRQGVALAPLHYGGLQEKKMRAGTENLSGICGMAKALELVLQDLEKDTFKINRLKEILEEKLLLKVGGLQIQGELENRLSNTTNLYVEGVDGESLLLNLDLAGIAASAGSACESGSIDPSHVLLAMGFDEVRARGSIRFSLSKFNTEEEVDFVAEEFSKIVERLRK